MPGNRGDEWEPPTTAMGGRIDRRTAVRAIGGCGVALGVAGWLGIDDVLTASDDEVEVTTALVRRDPDDPFSITERTRTVPVDWYEALEQAVTLNERLARVAFTGYLGSAVVPGSYESATASVSVGLSTDDGSLGELVGDLVNGVSLDTESILDLEWIDEGPTDAEPRVASRTDSQLASGVACETPSSMATLGPALYDPADRRSYFVTAEHAFEEPEPVTESALYLPVTDANRTTLGEVTIAHETADVALVEPTGDLEPPSVIDGERPRRVRGQLTRVGLADLIARGESLEKVGAVTGHTSGRIQGIDAVTCFTDDFCRRGQLRWGGEMDLTDGDSGSVSYYDDPDGAEEDVLVAGFNNARTWWPGQSYVWGIAAASLTERHGYHF